ncbi:hypothetical protein DLAC_06006 [Tieghemostelium lacteum]|uniref:Selenoprotein n=1 Tax=Tieghemostelium lacteum TaxID=361077 RepID=A0A151ZH95_TIELA|nr:hypothetical protein DLAC_06006 [Tieghemostelium lacteum]|eukprot:KYQ93336.1 hypothetical protein DLAC_06006 [Tieghemostelium lacteum]
MEDDEYDSGESLSDVLVKLYNETNIRLMVYTYYLHIWIGLIIVFVLYQLYKRIPKKEKYFEQDVLEELDKKKQERIAKIQHNYNNKLIDDNIPDASKKKDSRPKPTKPKSENEFKGYSNALNGGGSSSSYRPSFSMRNVGGGCSNK